MKNMIFLTIETFKQTNKQNIDTYKYYFIKNTHYDHAIYISFF